MSKSSEGVSRRSFLKGASIGIIGAGALANGAASLVGCASGSQSTEAKGEGKASATAKGYGGEVTVDLAADPKEGTVTEVSISGDLETPQKGGRAIPLLEQAMLGSGSVFVDGISGATTTSSAVLAAASAAYGAAMKGDGLKVQKMRPGSYTATAKSGYWRIKDLPVTVTVNEDAILKIETPEDRFEHGDTEVILQCAKEKFIPRIIENQSLNVDVVSGATQSCAGIRAAARAALRQAFEANEVDPSAVGKFDQKVDLAVKSDAPAKELEADVLVVGLGTGGCIATLNACEKLQERNGKKLVSLIAIDRAGKIGGKSALTHEAIAVNPPEYMKTHNNGQEYIDKEDFRSRWTQFCTTDGQMLGKQECIDVMVDQSGETVDWMYAHGWRFGTVGKGAGTALTGGLGSFNSVCTSRADAGSYEDRRKLVEKYQRQLIDQAVAQGAKLMLETEGYEIIVEGDKVTGVKARNVITGQEYVIKAKSVIMNTGGFSTNTAMMNALLDEPYHGLYKTVGTGTDTGLMVQAALDVGAGTFNMGMPPITMHCGTDHWIERYPFNELDDHLQNRTGRKEVWSLNNVPLGCAYNKMAISVNLEGKRFMDEASYIAFSQSVDEDSFPHWRGGAKYYSIVSDEILSKLAAEGFATTTWDGYNNQGILPKETPVPEVYEAMDFAVEDGVAFKADSVEELAGTIGIDAAALKATVDAYNKGAETGSDAEFGKAPEFLQKLGSAPFYAIELHNATFGTCGGLDVDASMRVLKDDHTTPIDGLYAIGNDSLGVIHNPNRHYCGFGGVAQGWLWTGGRIAGEHAANYVADTFGCAEVSVALSELPSTF